MSWYKRIKKWMEYSDELYLEVGERPLSWINSFKQDIKRWGFPIRLGVRNPVIVKGKVPVYLEKEGCLDEETKTANRE